MVPTQDVVLALSRTTLSLDETMPALVVGVVLAASALALVLASWRRRDAE